jgi:hypothetical protein
MTAAQFDEPRFELAELGPACAERIQAPSERRGAFQKPFALPPGGLLHERCPKFEEIVRAVREHAQDGLAVCGVERDDLGFAVVGAFEAFGGLLELDVAEPPCELEHGTIGDGDASEPHRALLHESKYQLAGSAAQVEVTGR